MRRQIFRSELIRNFKKESRTSKFTFFYCVIIWLAGISTKRIGDIGVSLAKHWRKNLCQVCLPIHISTKSKDQKIYQKILYLLFHLKEKHFPSAICHDLSIWDNISHTSWNTIKIWEFLWKYFPIPMVRIPDDRYPTI